MRTWARLRVGTAAAVALLALGAPADAASAHDDAQAAAVALARKAADLLALNAFAVSGQSGALQDALAGLPLRTPAGRTALLARLHTDDAAAASDLARLTTGGRTLSLETRTALAALSASQIASVTAGKAMTDPGAGVFLEALDDLVVRDGSPPATTGVPPNPQEVNSALAQDLSTAATSPSSSSLSWLWFALAVVVVVLIAVVGALSRRGKRRPGSAWRTPTAAVRPRPATPPTHLSSTQPASVAVHTVLDASRRLTMLPVADDMSRAIVREAMALVLVRAAALVERRGGELVLVHESQPGLLLPSGFGGGVVEHAANTGRVVAQLVTGDPSFARQPVQALVLPLVSAGRVEAVVIVVRDAAEPFSTAERELLATFAPVAAAARESASRTQAAVDASMIDPLTGIGNRRQLDAQLAAVLEAANGTSTALCMVDLDHFKSVNDTYGHPAGDALLRAVCDTIRRSIRPTDGVYRYGGEEFCILLPGATLAEAQETAERVRAAIAASSFDVGGGQMLSASASLGVAVTEDADTTSLVQRADRALYDAKHGGRNRVCVG